MRSIGQMIRENMVLFLAWTAALVSMIAVPPTAAYAGYINMPVLAVLFCLMIVIGGLRESGVFAAVLARLLLRLDTMRQLAAVLIFACFFVSMWVTNDVSLLTFVPFSLMALPRISREKQMAWSSSCRRWRPIWAVCVRLWESAESLSLFLLRHGSGNLSGASPAVYTRIFRAAGPVGLSAAGNAIPVSVRLAARRTRNMPYWRRHGSSGFWEGCSSFPCSRWPTSLITALPWPWSPLSPS